MRKPSCLSLALTLSVFLAVQIAIFVFFALKKEGLFVDEFWSFNLSNSAFFPLLKNATPYVGKILDGDFFRQVTTVQPDQQFWYYSVFFNQGRDVHPPLFYCMLHTVCSFFPDSLSKWYGIVPNIVCFCLTQLVIFRIACRLWNGWFRLLPCVMFGLTIGAVNMVTLVRMYSLLTLICTCAFALHLWIAMHCEEDGTPWPRWMVPALFLTTALGLLTHYYFILYAFFMAGFLLFLLKARNLRETAMRYVKVMAMACATAVVIFPYIIGHVVFRGRGHKAFVDAFTSSIVDRAGMFLNMLDQDLNLYPLLVLLLGLVLLRLVSSRGRLFPVNARQEEGVSHDEEPKGAGMRGFLLRLERKAERLLLSFVSGDRAASRMTTAYAFAIVCPVFLVVAKVVPLYEDRYVLFLFPLLAILFSFLLHEVYCQARMRFFREKNADFLFLILVALLMTGAIFLKQGNVKYLYAGEQAFLQDLHAKYKSELNIAVSAKDEGYDWYPAIKSFKFMQAGDRCVIVPYESLDSVHFDVESVTVYVNNPEGEQEIVERISRSLGMGSVERLPYDKDHQGIYRMHR